MANLREVQLRHDEYLSEYGGRFKAGSFMLVPADVAVRWMRGGIAEPIVSDAPMPTYADIWSVDTRPRSQLAGLRTIDNELVIPVCKAQGMVRGYEWSGPVGCHPGYCSTLMRMAV